MELAFDSRTARAMSKLPPINNKCLKARNNSKSATPYKFQLIAYSI
jgi:hypothetical protein